MAPFASSVPARSPNGTLRTSPPNPVAKAAAVPAAWPIAMHWAIDRIDAWASCSAEKHRPAMSVLTPSRAIRCAAVCRPLRRQGGTPRWSPCLPRRDGPHRCTAQADLVIELRGRDTSSLRDAIVPEDPPRLPKPDLRAEATRLAPAYPGTLSMRNLAYSNACFRPRSRHASGLPDRSHCALRPGRPRPGRCASSPLRSCRRSA